MKRELTLNEIIFSAACNDVTIQTDINRIPKNKTTLNKIKKALSVEKDGYNIYYVDSFSKEKLEDLINYIESIYENKDRPQDICYVISGEYSNPLPLFVPNGKGNLLKEMLDDIKEKYIDCISDFYSSSSDEEKEGIIEEISEKRNNYITSLMNMAKAKNFDIKATSNGFVFVPLKDQGNEMTKDEYNNLEGETQESIEKQASNLKKEAEIVLEKLKEIETDSIGKLKNIYKDYLSQNMQKYKDYFLL